MYFFAGNILFSELCIQSWSLLVHPLSLLDCYHTVDGQVSGSHTIFMSILQHFVFAKSGRLSHSKILTDLILSLKLDPWKR